MFVIDDRLDFFELQEKLRGMTDEEAIEYVQKEMERLENLPFDAVDTEKDTKNNLNMLLHINHGNEADLQIEIEGWGPPVYDDDGELITSPWCDVNILCQIQGSVCNPCGEIWESAEVCDIRDLLRELLDDKLEKEVFLEFWEPDVTMTFYPGKVVEKDLCYFQEKSRHNEKTPCFEIDFSSWPESHKYIFDKEVAEAVYYYLQLVTGELDKTSPIILKMIEAGSMVELNRD